MQFDALYEELTQSIEMIRSLLAGVTQNEARSKPSPESWSMLELLGHLYDEEREDFREHLDFILNRQHDEWHSISPEKWVAERRYNEQELAAMKECFFEELRKSLDWLKGLANRNWDTTYMSKWGARSAGDIFASWVAHDNLAVRQFVELRRHRIEEITKPYSINYAGDW